VSTWFRRVWHLLNRRRRERELIDEMRDHRAQMAESATFGDSHRLLERSRDEWGWNWLDDASQDLRLGVRSLVRSSGFAVTAMLMLAFGIGLNLTLYQMVDVTLLRGPAIAQPETMARLYHTTPEWNSTTVPYVLAQAVAERTTALSAVLAESATTVAWGDDKAIITASFVTPNWFDELGYEALHGRTLHTAVDGHSGAAPVVVLSHQFWSGRLGGRADIVGTTVRISDRPVTIVGIMPARFPGLDLDQPEIWAPITQREFYYPDSPFLQSWENGYSTVYGRLQSGVSLDEAREQLKATLAAIHREDPSHVTANEGFDLSMATENFMRPSERFEVFAVMSLIGTLSGLVLLVCAANIGNLVLSRTTGRARELGVRVALGARRSRIVRQLLVETLPLGVAGAAGGLLLAVWGSASMAALTDLPRYLDFAPDWRLLVMALTLGAVALTVAGALPAWKVAQQDLNDAIKDGGQQVSMRLDRARVRRVMLAAQVAGSCVLLVIAVMTARSLQRLLVSDLGFQYERTALLQSSLGRFGIKDEAARAYWTVVKERVAAHPDTAELALVLAPPFGGRVHETDFGDAPGLEVISNNVEPSYFAVMQIPILVGRTFVAADDPKTTVMISRRLAVEMYGRLDVAGESFPRSTPDATIVGVTGDAQVIKVGASGVAELYRPLSTTDLNQAVLLARSRTSAERLLPVLREAATVASARVMTGVRPLSADFERRIRGREIASAIAVTIGLITLVQACLGIFGVVSYGVALRTKEIGIHVAVGAGRRPVIWLVVRQVLSPIVLGMAAGAVLAAGAGIALSKSPLQLQSTDPLAFLVGLTLFIAAGAIAAVWPAVVVLRGNPVSALRHS
jgi:predicted permease